MEKPIRGGFSMRCNGRDSKLFEILFSKDVLLENPKLRLLLRGDGRLLLRATNRIARESILLTFAVASYCDGFPSKNAILFHCNADDNNFYNHQDKNKKITNKTQEDNDDDSVSITFEQENIEKQNISLLDDTKSNNTEEDIDHLFQQLQQRVELAELGRKNCEDSLKNTQYQLESSKAENKRLVASIKSQEQQTRKITEKHSIDLSSYRQEIEKRDLKISNLSQQLGELEKSKTSLKNECAVMKAQLDACNAKLDKMATLEDEKIMLEKQLSVAKESEEKLVSAIL